MAHIEARLRGIASPEEVAKITLAVELSPELASKTNEALLAIVREKHRSTPSSEEIATPAKRTRATAKKSGKPAPVVPVAHDEGLVNADALDGTQGTQEELPTGEHEQ